MLDGVRLRAIDLPKGWDIAPDERMAIGGAAPTSELVAWRNAWLPQGIPALAQVDLLASDIGLVYRGSFQFFSQLPNGSDNLWHGIESLVRILLQHFPAEIINVFRQVFAKLAGCRRMISQNLCHHFRNVAINSFERKTQRQHFKQHHTQ